MSHAGNEKSTGFRVARLLVLFIYGFAIVCTVILAMAFFLELFNANQSTPFVRWVFRATERIMQPFRGIFPAIEGESGSVFDPALLFAMFIYWLFALGMHALVGWIDRKIAAARYRDQWDGAHASTVEPTTQTSVARPSDPGRP
jgi:uncharacterized protein YggT (Ycf19 family)